MSSSLASTLTGAVQTLITDLVQAGTYIVQGLVDFLAQNYDLIGLIVGFGLLFYIVMRYVRPQTILGWLRGLF